MTFKLMIDYYDTDNYVVIAVVIIHIIEGLLTWHWTFPVQEEFFGIDIAD